MISFKIMENSEFLEDLREVSLETRGKLEEKLQVLHESKFSIRKHLPKISPVSCIEKQSLFGNSRVA